jgi:hypothetical protein
MNTEFDRADLLAEARVLQSRLSSEVHATRGTLHLLLLALLGCATLATLVIASISLGWGREPLGDLAALLPGILLILLFVSYRLLMTIADFRGLVGSVEGIRQQHQSALWDAERFENLESNS